jgi:hypothetical protein
VPADQSYASRNVANEDERMKSGNVLRLSNDTPKNNPWQDDELGFSGFAERLFRTILEISSPDGFVVGLCGPWGSGKTTALNFTKAYLKKYNQELQNPDFAVTVVDFEPWLFSGSTDLISAFFEVLAENLPDKEGASKRFGKKAGWFAKRNSDSLAGLVAAVGVTVDPTMGVISGTATTMGKRSLERSLERWLETPSLQSAYANLSERLKADKRRIVVFIDDLDRLSTSEIRSMMQMVKSVGKLPFITYVLSYDRKHVLAALDETKKSDALEPTFAEKIVQQELVLPQPSKSALLSLLDREIGFIAAAVDDSSRWHTIVSHGIRRWMKTPRDVHRYTNALRFIWPELKNEIDPADILAIEGLRLFEPRIFDWIKVNRDFLFSEGTLMLAEDELKQERIDALHDLIASHSDKSIIRLLACLFPSRTKQITGKDNASKEQFYQIVRRRGIGQVNAFQTYMAFRLSEDTVPHATIQSLISNLSNEVMLDAILDDWLQRKKADGEPVIGELLTEIQYRMIEPKAIKPTQELLNALFSIGAKVSALEVKRGWFELGPAQILYLLIADILDKTDRAYRFTPLQAALKANRNVAYSVQLLCDFGRLLGKIGDNVDRKESPIDEGDWETFADEIKPLFEEDLASGSYFSYPKTWFTIRVYAYFYGDSACKEWVIKSASANQTFLLGSIRSLLTESTSSDGTSYAIKDAPDQNIYDLEELLRLARVAKDAAAFQGEDLERLDAYIAGAVRWMDANAVSSDENGD